VLNKWIAAAGLDINHHLVARFTQQETADYFQEYPGAAFSDASWGRAVIEARATRQKVRFGEKFRPMAS
jgi:hypothetical protein